MTLCVPRRTPTLCTCHANRMFTTMKRQAIREVQQIYSTMVILQYAYMWVHPAPPTPHFCCCLDHTNTPRLHLLQAAPANTSPAQQLRFLHKTLLTALLQQFISGYTGRQAACFLACYISFSCCTSVAVAEALLVPKMLHPWLALPR